MSDDRTASPLIRIKGQAVLGYASAMDREHCARPVARLRTCLSYVTKRHREGDWQLISILSARLLHPATTTQPKRVLCHARLLIQSQSGEVALVRESHFRLSPTVYPRPFLLQVTTTSLCSTGWQRHFYHDFIRDKMTAWTIR